MHGVDAEHVQSPAAVMGHGGHVGMSMAGMTANMRNRFLIAAVNAVMLKRLRMPDAQTDDRPAEDASGSVPAARTSDMS